MCDLHKEKSIEYAIYRLHKAKTQKKTQYLRIFTLNYENMVGFTD